MAGNNLSPIEALQIAAEFAKEHKLWVQPNANGYYDKTPQTLPDEKVRILTQLAEFLMFGGDSSGLTIQGRPGTVPEPYDPTKPEPEPPW